MRAMPEEFISCRRNFLAQPPNLDLVSICFQSVSDNYLRSWSKLAVTCTNAEQRGIIVRGYCGGESREHATNFAAGTMSQRQKSERWLIGGIR